MDRSGLTVMGADAKKLRQEVKELLAAADELPIGDPTRRKFLEAAQTADHWATTLEIREEVAAEEAQMDSQQPQEEMDPTQELVERGLDLRGQVQESLELPDLSGEPTKDQER